MWAASWLASPPTSRPPMALGCPVSDSGPIPGLPMRPVARWQLMMALTLSVPWADWFTPWEKQVTTFSVAANQEKKRAMSSSAAPVATAVVAPRLARSPGRAASASAKPRVCAADEGRIDSRPAGQVDQQSVEQDGIAAATHRQMQVGCLRSRRCAADRW